MSAKLTEVRQLLAENNLAEAKRKLARMKNAPPTAELVQVQGELIAGLDRERAELAKKFQSLADENARLKESGKELENFEHVQELIDFLSNNCTGPTMQAIVQELVRAANDARWTLKDDKLNTLLKSHNKSEETLQGSRMLKEQVDQMTEYLNEKTSEVSLLQAKNKQL